MTNFMQSTDKGVNKNGETAREIIRKLIKARNRADHHANYGQYLAKDFFGRPKYC